MLHSNNYNVCYTLMYVTLKIMLHSDVGYIVITLQCMFHWNVHIIVSQWCMLHCDVYYIEMYVTLKCMSLWCMLQCKIYYIERYVTL